MSDKRYCWELMHALSERILRSNSATEELERWCAERAIGDGRIVAIRARNAKAVPCDDESLEALYPHDVRGQAKFRLVELATAGIVVVDAFNWYFPDRLTLDMRKALETTDTPFGRVVKPLKPKRRTYLVRRRTPGQMMEAKGPLDPGATAFEHRAVIYGQGDIPIAVVHERFRNILVCGVSEFLRAGQPERPADRDLPAAASVE